MATEHQKFRLLILAKRMARTAREHQKAVKEHDVLLHELGLKLSHNAGAGVGDVDYLPDWYVEKTEYGQGELTEADIERLLSELNKER